MTIVARARTSSHVPHATHGGRRGARSAGGAIALRVEVEPVADTGLGVDEPRMHRVRLELAAERGDVDAEVLLGVAAGVPPDSGEQLAMRERAPGVGEQRPEEIPLG